MYQYSALALVLLLFGNIICKADEIARQPIDTLLAESDFAGIVHIVAGEQGPNGVMYQAQIVQSFTADSIGPFIFFGRYPGIEIGREYLVFLMKSSMTVHERFKPRKEPIVLFDDTVKFNSPLDYRESRFMTITAPYYMMMLDAASAMSIDNPWGVFEPDELTGYPESVKIPYDVVTLPDSIESIPIAAKEDRLYDYRWVRKSDVVSYLLQVREHISKHITMEVDDSLITGGDRGIFGYANYRASIITSIDSLPDFILDSATNHLRQRLGDRFFTHLRLMQAIVVDSATFYGINPGWTNKPPMFSLQYMYADTAGGIAGFWGQLKLNSWGSVYEEIGFPEIRGNPVKSHIISLHAAKRIAIREGFPSHGLQVELKYSKEIGSIIWHFSYNDEEIRDIEFHILIDAHSGDIVRTYNTWGYEIEW